MFEWDGAFADLIDHPWSVAVLKAVMGRYVRLDHARDGRTRTPRSGRPLRPGPVLPGRPRASPLRTAGVLVLAQ
jgi:hypothetical protein